MQIEQRRVENPLVDPGMFTSYPPYNLGISCKFLSKESACDLRRNSYVQRPKTQFFQLYLVVVLLAGFEELLLHIQ